MHLLQAKKIYIFYLRLLAKSERNFAGNFDTSMWNRKLNHHKGNNSPYVSCERRVGERMN